MERNDNMDGNDSGIEDGNDANINIETIVDIEHTIKELGDDPKPGIIIKNNTSSINHMKIWIKI